MAEPTEPHRSTGGVPEAPPSVKPGVTDSPVRRSPFRAWLVSGPVGRLFGFILDLARELWNLANRRHR